MNDPFAARRSQFQPPKVADSSLPYLSSTGSTAAHDRKRPVLVSLARSQLSDDFRYAYDNLRLVSSNSV
jgi:hypothetical protein